MPPKLDSLSNYEVKSGQRIYGYGSGLAGASGVTVGDAAATDVYAAEDDAVLFVVPHQPGGSRNWVVVTGHDGSTSPCEGEAQLLTYVDEVFDPPVGGAVSLQSITPSPVTVGRADSYWVLGSGLAAVSVVVFGPHACTYETHDDTRLLIHIPEFHIDSTHATMDLAIHTPDSTATLAVDVVPLADALPADQQPWIGHLDPPSLPASGGRLTIMGGGLHGVTSVGIGNAEVTLEEVHDERIVVSVGSLAEYVHTQVAVEAVSPVGGTPVLDATMLRVTEG
jgi:hypothetical protein